MCPGTRNFDKGEGASATSRKRPGQGSGRGERSTPRPPKIAKSLSQVAAKTMPQQFAARERTENPGSVERRPLKAGKIRRRNGRNETVGYTRS